MTGVLDHHSSSMYHHFVYTQLGQADNQDDQHLHVSVSCWDRLEGPPLHTGNLSWSQTGFQHSGSDWHNTVRQTGMQSLPGIASKLNLLTMM